MALVFNDLSRRFRNGKGFGPISGEIPDTARWIGIHGPNGSGKSTCLRVIAGMELADSGSILLHGSSWLDRPIGPDRGVLVWQGRTVFPDLTARQNIDFAWRTDRVPRELRDNYARFFQLNNPALLAQKASTLSGGEAQRVSILRALLTGPRLLLLDEPFGQQDARTKKELVRCFHSLRLEMNDGDRTAQVPGWVFLVSHDEEELLSLVDTVLVLDGSGSLVSHGSPRELLDSPRSIAVADLIGMTNKLTIHWDGEARLVLAGTEQHYAGTSLSSGYFVRRVVPNANRIALIPAVYLFPVPESGNPDGFLVVDGRLERVVRRVAGYELAAVTPSGEIAVSFLSIREYEGRRLEVGHQIRFCFDPIHLCVGS
jgi:sulfate/thiosulfate transport system ATP-binding protein